MTEVPYGRDSEQLLVQELPEGEVTTVPEPDIVTDKVKLCSVKTAPTVVLVVGETEQVPVPVQAPVQPENW